MRLLFRLIFTAIYFVIGLILAPIFAIVMFFATIPSTWKASAKTFSKKKKPASVDIKPTIEANDIKKGKVPIYYPFKGGNG